LKDVNHLACATCPNRPRSASRGQKHRLRLRVPWLLGGRKRRLSCGPGRPCSCRGCYCARLYPRLIQAAPAAGRGPVRVGWRSAASSEREQIGRLSPPLTRTSPRPAFARRRPAGRDPCGHLDARSIAPLARLVAAKRRRPTICRLSPGPYEKAPPKRGLCSST
jgi:hypothetical protein